MLQPSTVCRNAQNAAAVIGRVLQPLHDSAMKFHLNQSDTHVFTAYGSGWVEINRVRHEQNLIAMPDRVIEPWAPGGFSALASDDFEGLLQLAPEIVLLGTGDTIRFPHPRLTAALTAARIGVDVMDVRAACRTFNVLSGEGRKVAAALLLR
jgi:uncharacterized protein